MDSKQTTPNNEHTHGKLIVSKKKLVILSLIFLSLAIGFGVLFGAQNQTIQEVINNKQQTTQEKSKASNTEQKNIQSAKELSEQESESIIYGVWTSQASVIKSLNMSTLKTNTLATLPLNVKKLTAMPDNSLLYINDTDVRDHGSSIVQYDIKTKQTKTIFNASTGFGIDDYVISPNKEYISLWIVKFNSDSDILYGGRSQVYVISLKDTTKKTLLYDENASDVVNYPRAVLDNGTVFTDKFLANTGNGWAYGMTRNSFDGTQKEAIGSMTAGTYSTQPELSPDGKYLAFAGYDGSKGDGNSRIDSFRRAIVSPNTVELLDTNTLQRLKVSEFTNEDSYMTVAWEMNANKVIVTTLSKTEPIAATYSYDLNTKVKKQISVPLAEGTIYNYLGTTSGENILIGTFNDNDANLGNLGEHYSYPYTQFSFMADTNLAEKLPLEDPFAQFITIVPNTYVQDVLGIKTIAQARPADPANPQPTFVDLYSETSDGKKNVQLYTFFLKYDLAKKREGQQSNPPVQINDDEPLPYNPDHDQLEKCNEVTKRVCAEQGHPEGSRGYTQCKGQYKAKHMNRTCDDSPLYLYGEPGSTVKVSIGTNVYNSIPRYNEGYTVTLKKDGLMRINEKDYSRIVYNYDPYLTRIVRPTNGSIVAKAEVTKTLTDYGKRLGLNEKEIRDLVKAGEQKVTSPYVFISFFDHETSQAILPLSFTPKPDNYLNVIFYFKLLDKTPGFTPVPPTFPQPVKRDGFTAVEVSEMVE